MSVAPARFLAMIGAVSLLGVGPPRLASQVPDVPAFTVYGMSEGLSQGSVEALIQDRRGFLWIGTHDGLNRFDGTGFTAFKHVRDDSTSLTDDFVRTLLETDDGMLWVGTERGGLNLFDPGTGEASHYPLYDLGPWRLDRGSTADGMNVGRTIDHMARMDDGSLILSSDLGFLHFDPATETTERLGSPSESEVRGLCSAPSGVAVGFSSGEVWTYSTRADWEPLWRFDTSLEFFRCQPDGEARIGTLDGVIHDLGLKKPSTPENRAEIVNGSDSIYVKDAVTLPDGSVWIGTLNGAFLAPPGTDVATRVLPGEPDRSIPDPWVQHLLVDESGVLWIGTWNGLASLHPLASSMKRVFASMDAGPGLKGAGVVAIEVDEDGAWLGSLGGGVQRLTESPGERIFEINRPGGLEEWPEVWVFDLEIGASGDLWIAGHADGAFRHSSDGGVERIPVVDVEGRPVTTVVLSVRRDRSGRVWAGSTDRGLLLYDTMAGHFAPVTGDDWDLGSNYVWPIVESPEGDLWIGAYNGGISRVDPAIGRMVRYTVGSRGLSDARILTLHLDSRGWVWVGTEGGGLNRIDPVTDGVKVYTLEDGLPHDHVEGIVEDDMGHLWISTNDGIARMDPSEETFRIFREAAGLAGNRHFANAAEKGPDGRLYFGGEEGLTIINPSRIEVDAAPPPVALTGFRIRGDDVPLARALAEEGLDLEPDENFFSFDFAALDYTDPTQNRYRYRLDPLEDEWVEAGPGSTATYTSVPPDDYVFRVAARNSAGVWNEDGLAIPVRVQAPFYMTWWFRLGIVALAVSLIAAFYSYRLRELRRLQEVRLGIAGRLHDDISANLSSIAMKADLVARDNDLAATSRAWLDEMRKAARESAQRVRETVWVVSTRYDNLPDLIQKMQDTADGILLGHLPYDFGVEPDPLPKLRISWELRQDLYLLYKEALHNALKYSRASHVQIRVTVDGKSMRIIVRDDGLGFDPQTVEKGNGLELMQARMARHKGHLAVKSEPGKGTEVSFGAKL